MNAPFPLADTLSAAPLAAPSDSAASVRAAATALLPHLERGQRVDTAILRDAMETAFGASDATGLWNWKTAYEACEVATVLFLRKYGKALFRKAGSPVAALPLLGKIAGLLPTHTRRSQESQALQQFSTPIPLGLVAATAAAITSADRVLEPSAGTGLLAILAELAGGSLVLNELADTRAALLSSLFPAIPVTRFDAAQIDDHLDATAVPSVVLMNPPFSAMVHVDGRMADAAFRHVASALARLAPGGRLVTITGANFGPEAPAWTAAFTRLQERGRVVFSAGIDGAVYAKHGTAFATRLTVIDKLPADDPTVFPASPGTAPDAATLMDWIGAHLPPRLPVDPSVIVQAAAPAAARSVRGYLNRAARTAPATLMAEPDGVALDYEIIDAEVGADDDSRISDAIYEEYGLQAIRISGSQAHPTKLVQSAAMASVAPPKPSYRPQLPTNIRELLSDAQLETLVYAGEAHSDYLAGAWTVDETFDLVSAARDDAEKAVRFRRGFFIGDGTGVGKGRQSAAIILDNWLQGRRKAVWISKSDKLLEDAQRDWSALGMERLLVTPLSRFPQGRPITLGEGVLFTTYATLRSDDRGEKLSRVKQIVEWLGSDFDGAIIFDEAHAMANAAGGKGERGDVAASQQGRAGLRLQHALPNARVTYVSATGATSVHNLAYAQRLGFWGGEDFPFATRAEFVEAIEAGGVAAMEVLARDLRALGLYTARSLSFDGVEYELVEHALTPEQTRIYDAYAGAFAIIHNNLDAAMEAANITGSSGTLNKQAKSAARSAFESAKQRFFGHLLTSMKTPTLIRSITVDLEAGHSAVIQIVSTGEALTERRLADIPTEEWNDIRADITPREYVLSYLETSFPVQLYEPFTDSDGKVSSRPVFRDGQPVESREAVARRTALIEKLASLPAVPGALDQIVQHFGTEMVAEVTGRSRRIVRKPGAGSMGDRLVVENRAASANLAETQAFMDDVKRVLIFSDAGGTGRSYHAELSARNTRLRVHYLLEPGWKADAAIQGLGRTHRTNQAQPPLFRPIATDVKAEKRFLSTIARRLDTLGAITRGQRQTGGQGLFRPEDNLESPYARDALRQLYLLLVRGKVEGCSLDRFESATGLKLMDSTGIKDDLPPITTFLNRLLALTIELQGILFTAFEQLLTARIEGAITSGTYDAGLETLTAERFIVTDRKTIYVHPGTGAETRLLTITQRERNRPLSLDAALGHLDDWRAKLLVNERSGRAAVQVPTTSTMLDDGEIERRVRLLRPMEGHNIPLKTMGETHWIEADQDAFAAAWTAEIAEVPEFADNTIHVVTGLLLPIWKRLPNESTRVYRLQTDDGERIIGRKVSPAWAANATTTGATALTPDDAFMALMDGRTILDLAEGLQLRRARVMGANRIELSGFTDTMRERLSADGLFHEIISWKLRMFVPVDANGPVVLAKLLERWPVERIGEKEAA
ncbi:MULTISPECIES: strawberry notch-like NTP hydrolase domain-containing protein [Hyphomicrobiales]|uniref:strawberry notch-like NTP hydrolase domain-containing protein n=1 Tax=Hyphomicrobiales TaxID=356 RepID=UPI00042595D2|nr:MULTISPECIES: strawberry notch family protein [Hyphomicrobiales]CAH1655575.1 Methylase [Hyphomicrobiales bacterium]MBS7740405.1 strawberry notch family protein [Chelatococcus sp. HY11]MBX3544811.1 strawberry notch family protein [Chelatococcus sp.]MCO5078354.1 strawberry notch family protein [Chelatococcus sp.]MCO5154682.1 strawberry notch family protein [Shinella sp.]